MDRRGKRSWIGNGLLALASVAAALVAAEAVVRAAHLGPQVERLSYDTYVVSDHKKLRYELRPGALDGSERISSAGLRDREYPLAAPPGVHRIAAIGDSITFGLGVPRAQSWPEQLERLLAEAARPDAPRFEVLNFGVAGYNIRQVVERLRVDALPYGPAQVVYGFALNDPQDYSYQGEIFAALKAERNGPVPGRRILDLGFAHSQLFRIAWAFWYELATPEGPSLRLAPDFVAEARDGRDRYFRRLYERPDPRGRLERGFAELHELSRASGVPIAVAIFPLDHADEDSPYGLASVHAAVAAEASEAGLSVIDLLPAFERARDEDRDAPLFRDFMHPTERGYGVAAGAILDALARSRPDLLDPARIAGGERGGDAPAGGGAHEGAQG